MSQEKWAQTLTVTLDKPAILTALQKGEILLQGQFLSGSNYTFLTQLVYMGVEMRVVYKPVRGEQPLWDFPHGSLAKRETAAFVTSEALGWELVPPTIFRRKAPLGPGSLQQYIEHYPEYHYFNFQEQDKQRLRPVALFDLLINNADRKGSHLLVDPLNHLWLIDHGICFHVQNKLRTVIWDFAGEEIPSVLLEDFNRFSNDLESKQKVYDSLNKLLNPEEIGAMIGRAKQIIAMRLFPYPGRDRRVFPWPPI